MPWLYLVIAGVLEIGWAVGLKYTDGFTKLVPTLLTVPTMIASFFFLALAVRQIPLGTGYAIWTGIGAIGTAIAGILLFGESAALARIACLVLVIVGLKLTAGG